MKGKWGKPAQFWAVGKCEQCVFQETGATLAWLK
jgi:hypothetical protein